MAKPASRKSNMMVRVTLSLAVQNKVLPALSTIGINESYPEPHVITMRPHIFGIFLAKCALLDPPPTLKEMKIELIDFIKEPRRTVIRYEKLPYEEVETCS
jgi:hypothetical protein